MPTPPGFRFWCAKFMVASVPLVLSACSSAFFAVSPENGTPGAAPSTKPAEKPAQKPAEKPAEKPVVQPAPPTRAPARTPARAPDRRRNEPPVTPPPAVVAPAPEPMDPEPSPMASDSAGVARLQRLMLVWHTAALHHPAVVRGAPWDSAFVRAATRVRSATTSAALQDAYTRLLTALGDSASRVETEQPAPVMTTMALAAVQVERLRDSVLLLRVPSASRYAPDAAASIANALAGSAPRVVLDLRTDTPGADPDSVDALFATTQLDARLSAEPYALSGTRMRRVGGARTDGDGVMSDDGWWQQDGRVVTPVPGANAARRVVVLANRHTVMPRAVSALLALGRATLIAEDAVQDAAISPSVRIPIGAGLVVRLRTGELVHPDGSVGLLADTVVGRAAQASDSAPALRTALTLLRTNRVVRAPRIAPLVRASPLPVYYDGQEPYPFMGARLLAGARVWGAMRARHAHRELYDDDIDALAVRAIPALESARSAQQYAAALRLLTGAFADAQVTMTGAAADSVTGIAAAPFRVRWIEDRAIITQVVRDATTSALGLTTGLEVTAADGFPLPAWVIERRGTVSAPNEWSRQRVLMSQLPFGPSGSALFRVRDALGKEKQIDVPRSVAYAQALPADPRMSEPAVRTLASGVTYMDLAQLAPDSLARVVRSAQSARAWVLDLRGTVQAADRVEAVLAAALRTRDDVVTMREVHRYVSAPCVQESVRDALTQCTVAREERSRVSRGDTVTRYSGRVVVLVDDRTQGAAERLALALEAVAPVTFVGTATAGSPADVQALSLPGGLMLSVPLREIRRADGSQVQRVGITPVVEFRPTVRGVRNGQDDVLERAQVWLQQLDPPRRRR